MLKILLCDDDSEACETLQRDVLAALGTQKAEWAVCADAQQVTERLAQGEVFSLCFLDIVMPGENGIALGRSIRAHCPRACIVYVTTSGEYALEAYGVHAFRYLLKPVRQSELAQLMAEFLAQYRLAEAAAEPIFAFKTRDGIVSVNCNEILWAENRHRSVMLVLRGRDSLYGMSSREPFEKNIEPLLKNGQFLQTHKSFVVNINGIQRLLPDSVVMDDGTRIPVSRNNAARVKRTYFTFLSNGG